jgi:hypothetical protein
MKAFMKTYNEDIEVVSEVIIKFFDGDKYVKGEIAVLRRFHSKWCRLSINGKGNYYETT